jgi:hypothetical protein
LWPGSKNSKINQMDESIQGVPADSIQAQEERGEICRLRWDLIELTQFLGKENLRDGILAYKLARCVEVGVGTAWDGLEMLTALKTPDGKPVFTPDNLWAVDPSSQDFIRLMAKEEPRLLAKITAKRWLVEDVAQKVKEGVIEPLDLLIAKGVVSFGGASFLSGITSSNSQRMLEKELAVIFKTIEAMKDCLSDNSSSVMVLSTTTHSSILPFRQQDLRKIGLEPVHIREQKGEGAGLFKIFQRAGVYPKEPGEKIFDLAICKKAPAIS